MCQANRGEADIPEGEAGGLSKKLQNMYLHSRPALCETQEFRFKQLTS